MTERRTTAAKDGGWRPVLLWAFAGTAFAVGMTLANLASTYDSLGGLVVTGPNDPAAKVFAEDMPGYPVLDSGRHDGRAAVDNGRGTGDDLGCHHAGTAADCTTCHRCAVDGAACNRSECRLRGAGRS